MLSFALAFFMLAPSGGSQTAVQNPGFESALAGWEVETRLRQEHGHAPTITVDANNAKEGTQSLLIESPDSGDAAARQRIFLPVGSLWRVRAWIKTEDLAAAGEGEAEGIIGIDTPGAEIASSERRSGTTPWQDAEVTFRVPSPGYIDLTLVGTRRGTGKSGLTMSDWNPCLPTRARTFASLPSTPTKRPIDAKQQGQFIELLCNLIPSIIAQQVVSTSFEDAPPCHVDYKKAGR